MPISFSKYHGTGNDFILIDNRKMVLQLSQSQIAQLCNRRFGIGADGLILLQMKESVVQMVYFNSDGAPSSMCGNGARCFVDFCQSLKVMENEGEFLAVDGMHQFKMENGLPSVKMGNVSGIEEIKDAVYLDTGSPHYVQIVEDLSNLDLVKQGRFVRYNSRFAKNGTNVNFVEIKDKIAHIRTYERGVENETLSCGTGATAVAIAMHHLKKIRKKDMPIKVVGGKLNISFSHGPNATYTNIWLTGPVVRVFDASIKMPTGL